MEDIADTLGMDPVACTFQTMLRPTAEPPCTTASLEAGMQMGGEPFAWPARRNVIPGAAAGPLNRGAGVSFRMFRAALGMRSAIVPGDARPRSTLFVGGTAGGPGAKTTLGLIAAEALGVPLAQVDVVSGAPDRCPSAVGESGSRTTIMTGMAVVDAVTDLQQQMAARGMPPGHDVFVASATPSPTTDGKLRQCFAAHVGAVAVETRLGTTRLTTDVAVHASGRMMNPQAAREQIRGAVLQGIGQALHADVFDDPASGPPRTMGYDRARQLTPLDGPTIDVHVLDVDDGYGPFGAKAVGESGIMLAPAAVAHARVKATGPRMTSLPLTRDNILGALG